MAYKRLFEINSRWGLSYDKNQWVISKISGDKWIPRSYIGSDLTMLRVALKRLGCQPTKKGEKALSGLKPRFLDWYRDQ